MEKKDIRIAVSSDRNFTPGITAIRGGAHICTGLSGDKPGVLLYRDGKKQERSGSRRKCGPGTFTRRIF